MPLKIQSTTHNFDFDHDYLTAISKLLNQTQTQMIDDIFETDEDQSVGEVQARAFNETIEEPIKAATSYYDDLYGDDEPQKSLLITYVRVFTDHITPRYLLETNHYVRSGTNILKIKDHLSELIQANKVIVHVVPLSEHPSTQQFELQSYNQSNIATIFETFPATTNPTTYLNELLSFNLSNWVQSTHSASETLGNELPLIKQTAVQLTGEPDIFKKLNSSEIADAQQLAKLLLMV